MPNEDICITCPHCHSPIMVYAKDINCAIFRHGVMKKLDYRSISIYLKLYVTN